MLLHTAVESEADVPPTAKEDGQCWLIGNSPTGE
ncbi:DUF2793 domain-containing protein [Allopontixanthobacter sediminis]|uniref:DUF2793 domain-containing protein n=1 Tax=Allopontixanthobacter sediminis TaxID=1689985 RepID=A0A845BAW6_9SPHN|nr:DUF2793 domain-containing protein [Allopontixanthobacter sediminis]